MMLISILQYAQFVNFKAFRVQILIDICEIVVGSYKIIRGCCISRKESYKKRAGASQM